MLFLCRARLFRRISSRASRVTGRDHVENVAHNLDNFAAAGGQAPILRDTELERFEGKMNFASDVRLRKVAGESGSPFGR